MYLAQAFLYLRQAARLAGRSTMFSVCPFVRSSVIKLVNIDHILQTNEPILTVIGTNDPWGKGIKRSILGVKVKVTRGRK